MLAVIICSDFGDQENKVCGHYAKWNKAITKDNASFIWTECLCLWYIFMLKPNPQCGGVWRSGLWEMTVEPSWMGLVLLKKRTQKAPLPLTPSPLPLPPLRIQQKDSHLWTREQALIRWLVCWPLASLSWTSSLKNYKQSISVFITFSIYGILL